MMIFMHTESNLIEFSQVIIVDKTFTSFVVWEPKNIQILSSPSVSVLRTLPKFSFVLTHKHRSVFLRLVLPNWVGLGVDLLRRHWHNETSHTDTPLFPSSSIKEEILCFWHQRHMFGIFLHFIPLFIVNMHQNLQTFSMGSMRIS